MPSVMLNQLAFWHNAKPCLTDHLQGTHPTQTAQDVGCGLGVVSHYLAGN